MRTDSQMADTRTHRHTDAHTASSARAPARARPGRGRSGRVSRSQSHARLFRSRTRAPTHLAPPPPLRTLRVPLACLHARLRACVPACLPARLPACPPACVCRASPHVAGRLLIMSTNDPQLLDAAIVRPGRIDKTIYLGARDARAPCKPPQASTEPPRASRARDRGPARSRHAATHARARRHARARPRQPPPTTCDERASHASPPASLVPRSKLDASHRM
jgi:hypothetical protein